MDTDRREEFLQVCGNAYVHSTIYGGHYYALLEAQTETDEQKRKIELALSSKYKVVEGKIELTDEQKQILKTSGVRYTGFEAGTSGPIATTYEEIVDRFETYPDLVKMTGGRPMHMTLLAYPSLAPT